MGQQELRSSLTIRAPNRRPHPSKGPAHGGVVGGITQLHACVCSAVSDAVQPHRL